MIAFDHLAIPARDPEAAARWLGDLLGLGIEHDGPENELACVALDGGARLMFAPDPAPAPLHFALRASADMVATVVARLRAAGIAFGNDPEAPDNGQTSDPLGGAARVYFRAADGHLFEICA